MRSHIKPYIINIITSSRLLRLKRGLAERRRIRSGSDHTVTVYLRINDPHSYILLQTLKEFSARYAIKFDFRSVLRLQSDMYPAPELWEKNAFADASFLAQRQQLDFPDTRPQYSAEQDLQITAQLLHWELQPGYLDNAEALFKAYWHQDQSQLDSLLDQKISDHAECYQHHLQANENLLKSNGHYLSAMLHYGDKPAAEWYWGLNRIEYLESRLSELGLDGAPNSPPLFSCDDTLTTDDQAVATNAGTAGKELVLYWSARSPYSYLGIVRARRLAAKYQIELVIKPVLPMIMRRMQVPSTKSFYILNDTKREANKHGLPFGFVADPLGKGVERCYALYEFAQSAGKGNEFMECFARGVWAQGIRSDTDDGLQKIVEMAGLDWQQAKPLLRNDNWRYAVQKNLVEMYSNDLWGVPSFRYGEVKVFGQDRLDRIEQAIIASN